MKIAKRIISALLAAAVSVSLLTFSAGAVQSYDEWISNSWDTVNNEATGYITLTPGTDRTKMNFSWQSSYKYSTGSICISKSENMTDLTYPKVKRSFNLFAFEFTYEATASDLAENTTYYYKYEANNAWSDVYSFKTGAADKTKFVFVTDPQIGRSKGDEETIYKNDTYGWTSTLDYAIENNSDIDFILSAGDQVEDSYSEKQYTLFESAPALRSIPVASAIGNHDFYTNNYKYHFNNPNENTAVVGQNVGGNGYYFSYNDILFIILDSNNINGAAQRKIIKAACKAYPNAKWRIAMMHHSPYDANSSSYFADKLARTTVAPYLDEFNIDLCLSGHDHYYSRSYIVKNKKVTSDKAVNDTYINPNGVLYVTGNSSSGSNYYGINENEITEYCDFYFQSDVPNYSVIEVEGNELTLTNYETETNTAIDFVGIVKNK